MMNTNKPYLSNLTALRGIAAILVVIFHSNEIVAQFIKPETTFWFRKLYLMVDLFFILSGFIMCYVYENYFNDNTQKNKIWSFLKARLARIYPLHIITLACCVLFAFIIWQSGKQEFTGPVAMAVDDFKAIPTQLLLLHSAHIQNIFTWNVPSWSISAEWLAYLLFPLLVTPFSKFNLQKTLITIGIILGLYALLIFYIAPNRTVPFPFFSTEKSLDLNYDWGFARGILGFVLGMCMYRLFVKKILYKVVANGWFLLVIFITYSVYMHFGFNDIAAPIFFSMVLLCMAYGSSIINTFFNNIILQKLGLWSFSIYMWHSVILSLVWCIQTLLLKTAPPQGPPPPPNYFGLTNPVTTAVFFISLSVIVGALSYHFIETPCRKWINGIKKN